MDSGTCERIFSEVHPHITKMIMDVDIMDTARDELIWRESVNGELTCKLACEHYQDRAQQVH